MEGIRGMFKGKCKTSSSRGNQGNCTSSSHLISTQDDFVDTQHFPTIPLDLDEELFSETQEDFNLDDDLDDTPTNVDDNTPTSAPSTEIPHIPPSMRRGPAKRPLKSDAWTFFDRDVENQASRSGVQTPAPSGQGSHTDTVPDQVHGQINPMTGEIVGSKYNKHRDREAISKLVAVEEGFVPYQEVINEDGHEDLSKYLEGNEKTFPTLSVMARDVLNIQASSTASKALFLPADIK
ncbi:hypothetical protein RND71_009879 [Anisodus tanguticus]|uniref:HAT C-terminal dimerisation domain-containing protein n=1 Tax=Anisodus tanguticus TaxID=243964 RepID=A0AAE1VRM8_9SOLA|nr:hypothetical protein RND71_009879 [Anisodus tanguticus]